MDNEKKELSNAPQEEININSMREPYPPIKVMGRNPRYANILLDSYAGASGELTAITTYLYQHHDSERILPEFASLLEDVAKVEMHHLDILASLIRLLGGDCRYYGCDGTLWTAKNVHCLTGDPCSQILAAIQAATNAITQYRHQVILIDDCHVRAILERIIRDEECHLALFKRLLHKHFPSHRS